jgi:isochorismate synthase EntC
LIGKVRLVSTWSSARVTDEITSVFSSSFGLEENEQLKFKYLSVVPGAKVLSVAKVSSSFSWSGHAVASLAGQGCIYILSEMQLKKTNLGQNIKEEREHAISINDSDSEHEIEVYNINPTRKFKLSMFYCQHNNLKYQTYWKYMHVGTPYAGSPGLSRAVSAWEGD